uniref:ABC transporter n=1 Tax=Candidatus Kentrum eta TaxID=2126337 RepID=A0A450V0C2_9GAMM|nr:MAG: ABC transporter [Candidatus Kentron sp. H]VFJ91675.1 MAG: ABC transporter [Candidatus Kentron sp. H]VFJ98274.1 MAG: ABC transporter [Candidatus Kentron sp. H]
MPSIRFYEHLSDRSREHDYWKLFRTRSRTWSLSDPTARLRQRCFGFLPQGGHLIDGHTVEENLIFRRLLGGLDPKVDIDALEPELLDKLKKSPSALSGGQRQKLALHRAVTGSPRIIFADEPTNNLDSDAFDWKLSELACLVQEQGVTVLMVTHSYERSLKVLREHFPALPMHQLNLQTVNSENARVRPVNLDYQIV